MSSPTVPTPVFGVPTFCIITGASRGIGRGIATSLGPLLGEKSLVVMTARSGDDLLETADLLKALSPGISVRQIVGDLSDDSSAEKTIAALFEGIDSSAFQHALLIHNAGSVGNMSYIRDLSPDLPSLAKYMTLNLTSIITLSAKFLTAFLKRDGLRRTVVNITSLCAIQTVKSLALYCSGKAARNMFMKSMAVEEPDVRVLNYAPGVIDTAMNKDITDHAGDAELREMFVGLASTPYFLTPAMTCQTLIKVLTEDSFESGAHVDYWDVVKIEES